MADHFHPARASDLRIELGFDKRDRKFKAKKNALRKIIANMSLNSAEMASMFPDVVACLPIPDLEVKRLCTLYIETYAKTRPELALDSLPTLVEDTRSDNPLIRSLALRTISTVPLDPFIRENIHLCRTMSKDNDPLVRVAAVYAMAKAWAYDHLSAQESGFQRSLNHMLNDKHPRVSATAVSCLLEVAAMTPGMSITINYSTALHLCRSLVNCNEWCQVYVLRILQYFVPTKSEQAAELLTNTFPRIQHANTAVVLASIRLTIYLLNFVTNYKEIIPGFEKTFHAPFSLLMSKPPQLQYIMLRNLTILLQSHPLLVQLDAQPFFSSYSDPTYVKISKIEVLFGLANTKNATAIIDEFYNCAADVDVDASRKAIHFLGQIGLKLPQFADQCVEKLSSILNSGAPYIVQEVAITMPSLMRKFPDRYATTIIPCLGEYKDLIFDDENAKVAFLWIIGQYPLESLDNVDIISELITTFGDEPLKVQLATLTTSVKLFIANPKSTKEIIPRVFEVASQEADDPDLRDRAYMYWRLLSHAPAKARDLVTSNSTEINNIENKLSDAVLEELDHSLGYLSSLYLKPPSKMFRFSKQYELPQSPCLVPRNQYRTTAPSSMASSRIPSGNSSHGPQLYTSKTGSTAALLSNPPYGSSTQFSRPNPPPTRTPTNNMYMNSNNTGSIIAQTPLVSQISGSSPFSDQTEKLIDI